MNGRVYKKLQLTFFLSLNRVSAHVVPFFSPSLIKNQGYPDLLLQSS